MDPIDIIGLAGWITLAVFLVACGVIMLILGWAAKRGDSIAARVDQSDR